VTDAGAEYVDGDINQVDDADDDELEEFDELDDADEDADELDDVDDLDDLDEDANGGNVAVGASSTAVLTHLATALADEPDAVSVETDVRGRRATFRLHVAQPDMGRVIGRRGRTAQAIRALVAAAGAREGLTTSVDIVD
jgi:predicted RNA-binding protein YlqC (UPF0109 family)